MDEITGNKGNDLTESQLKEVLKKYFVNSEIPEELPNDLSSLQLTALKNENYKIKVSDIYNGNLLKSQSSAKLTEIVKNTDYGKSIDYSVTVNGTTLNNWKVFLNDGNNVYIILGDNLTSNLMPDLGNPVEKYDVSSGYGVYNLIYEGDGSPEDITDRIMNTELFQDFASGTGALSAVGAPTLEQFETSYGQTIHEGDILEGVLYNARWLATWNLCIWRWAVGIPIGAIRILSGEVMVVYCEMNGGGIRPLVKLNGDATGSVGSTVTIDK